MVTQEEQSTLIVPADIWANILFCFPFVNYPKQKKMEKTFKLTLCAYLYFMFYYLFLELF